jgi:hypothetical protein
MERADEERRGAVSGEYAARPVRTVRGRSESDDGEPSPRVAEPWDAPSPVGLGPELAFLFERDPLAVEHETRAPGTGDHLGAYPVEGIGHAGDWTGTLREFGRPAASFRVLTERDLSL